jgi:hypothetical protein
MRFFASRTTTGAREPFSFFENVSAGQASYRKNGKPSSLGRYRARNMAQMVKYLFLPDPQGLGKLSGRHFLLAQKSYHTLANGLWVIVFAHAAVLPSP